MPGRTAGTGALAGGARARVALVVPAFEDGGGVPAVAEFLHRVMEASGRYAPFVLSLASSSADDVSTRVSAPATWGRGPRERPGRWRGIDCVHVGASAAEVETRRYLRRAALDRHLATADLVQVVAGFPAWACCALGAGPPVALQVATLAAVERGALLRHGPLPLRAWRAAMTARVAALEDRALRGVDAVFVENRWMHDRVSPLAAGRTHFAPPGVDTAFFTPGGSRGGYLLSVGRFWDPRKNVRLLFEAYARLRGLLAAPPPLVLAGAAPSAADMAHAERLGIAPHLTVHENVPAARLRDLYRGAAAFVLSSDEEGFGLVIAEAMAAGLPVAATDCGGPSTSVLEGRTGRLSPVGDADALAAAVHGILRDPAAADEMGRLGRERAVAEFSLEAAGERFLSVYDRLLGTGPVAAAPRATPAGAPR